CADLAAGGPRIAAVEAILRRPQAGEQSICGASAQTSLGDEGIDVGNQRREQFLWRLGGTFVCPDVRTGPLNSRIAIEIKRAGHPRLNDSSVDAWRSGSEMKIAVRQINKLGILRDIPCAAGIGCDAAMIKYRRSRAEPITGWVVSHVD